MNGDSDFWVKDNVDQVLPQMKRKRKAGSKIIEYKGWASTVLTQFLNSIGRDASTKLSQHDVTNIVKEYVNNNNLTIPEKKKRILCDEKLFALFGKKSIPRIKIQNLLEPHFLENKDSSEDEFEYGSDEEGVKTSQVENKASKSERKNSSQKQKVPEPPRSCFASVIPANIRLVYLKRSLLQEFAKVPGSVEDKVLGCFVRIKSDPNDYLQKNSHQLQQVIGITSKADNSDSEIHLRLSNYFRDVPLHLLSDDNFTEEECVDLHERVKVGELKRPTVVEIEAKATMLHADITKHWISREISLLQKLIDRANEKGWRREMYSYMERKQLLEKPAEHEKLFSEMPKVIADPLEVESTETALENVEEGSLPENSFCRDTIPINCDNGHGNLAAYSQHTDHLQEVACPALVIGNESNGETAVVHTDEVACPALVIGKESNGETAVVHTDEVACPALVIGKERNGETAVVYIDVEENSCSQMPATKGVDMDMKKDSSQMPASRAVPIQVIELSDDEDEVTVPKNQNQSLAAALLHPEDLYWHYQDPQGQVQGPFALTALKRWNDNFFFHKDFRVWKIGQSPYDSLLLTDVLSLFFPSKMKRSLA